MAEAPKGFLGRWARRKTESLQGKPLDEPVAVAQPDALDAAGVPVVSPGSAASALAATTPSAAAQERPQEKVLSLDDVKLLTRDSDFKPFMANNVAAEVRNAAMKKLFADPHFNVMDGLDTYIGDYSQPDPVSPSMLRQMAGAKFLNLFDNAEKGDAGVEAGAEKQNGTASLPRENAHGPNSDVEAQSPENLERIRTGHPGSQNAVQPASWPGAAASQPDPTPAAPDAGSATP